MTIRVKRVYLAVAPDDGYRVLVDRLWPRGLTHEAVAADLWLREIAPSTDLRRWYGHAVERWPEFDTRYRAELADHADLLDRLAALEREHGTVTLLFAARDEVHNEAEVLADVLRARTVP